MSDYQYGYSGPPLIVVCRHCASKTEMTAASAIKFGGDDALWQVGCPSCHQPILETDVPTAEALAAEAEGAMDFEDPQPARVGAERALKHAFFVLLAMDPGEISPTRLKCYQVEGNVDFDIAEHDVDDDEGPIMGMVDGTFGADQLEAIAAWIRDPRGVASAAPPPDGILHLVHPEFGAFVVLYDEAGEYIGVKRP